MPVAATKPTKNLTALRYDSIVRGFVRSGSSSVIQADLARPLMYRTSLGAQRVNAVQQSVGQDVPFDAGHPAISASRVEAGDLKTSTIRRGRCRSGTGAVTSSGLGRLHMMSVLTRNNVRVAGQAAGQPMMFAHGFGCDQNMWRFVVPTFEDAYRVVLFATWGRDGPICRPTT